MSRKWKAPEIKQAIAKRHRDDMFFTEVKNGPTQVVQHHSKIDALAIKISWTNFGIIGYEVKVSRSDFLRDEKWRSYLPMCNQLYFAVAPGVCEVSEIPESCGLVTVTPKGGLRTVRKAPWRDIDMPVEMLLYLMFTYIGPLYRMDWKYHRAGRLLREDDLSVYQDYLENKVGLREMGRKVSARLQRDIWNLESRAQGHDEAVAESRHLSSQMREISKALGVSDVYRQAEKCLEAIQELKSGGALTPASLSQIRNASHLLNGFLTEMDMVTQHEPSRE